jgi:hypothetical protein
MQHLQKTGGGISRERFSTSLVHSAPSSIFRTLFHVPYRVTPVFATLAKTAGCRPKIPISRLTFGYQLSLRFVPNDWSELPQYPAAICSRIKDVQRELSRKSPLAAEEFFEEEAGKVAGVVAEDAVFFKEIIEDDAETKLLEGGKVDNHGFGSLSAIAAGDFR